jgi:hypothetical protein
VSLNHGLTLERLLDEAAGENVVLVDDTGKARFTLISSNCYDAITDDEVAALQSNPEFMRELTRWESEPKTDRVKTQAQVREELEVLDRMPAILGSLSPSEADSVLKKIGVDPGKYGMSTAKELLDYWKRCVEDLNGD